jgi:O-antigen ligase
VASVRGLLPFQPRPAGVAPTPWRRAPTSAVLIPLGLTAVGLGVGVLAGIDPKLAIAAALGLGFAGLVIANITVGLCLFVGISFLEVLGRVGGSIGATKAFGLLLVVSWLAAVSTRNEAENDFVSVHPTMTYLLAIFLAWSTFSMIWAESSGAVLHATSRYLQNLLLFLIVFTAIRKREHAVWMTAAFVAGASVAAIFAIIYHPSASAYDVSRASGTVGDPNELAAVLVAGIILAGVLFVLLKRSPLLRMAAAGAALLCALGLFVTFSRGGLVALACAMVAGLFVAGRWRPAIATTMACVALLGIAYFALFAPQSSRDRITKLDGGTGRTDIWRVGGRMVSAHPIRGVGSGNFQLVSAHYLLQKPGAIKGEFFIDKPKVAHNMYLHVLAELGIVGLSLFVAILGFALACAFRAARRFGEAGDLDMELLTRGLILALIGLLAADVFLSGQFSKQLWLLLGLAPAMLAIATTRARRRALGSF